MPAVQTFAAQKVANYFADELDTKITIKSLEIEFFDKLDLQELYIEDQHQDTLAYLHHLLIGLNVFDWEGHFLTATLEMKRPTINLTRNSADSTFNYKFLSDYFITNKLDTSRNNWKFKLSELTVSNAEFHLHDYTKVDTSTHINYSHLDVEQLSLFASNLNYNAQLLKVKLDSLSGIEENGFELDYLTADLSISKVVMDYKNLIVQTSGSRIEADIRFTANSFADYVSFNELVYMAATFNNSLIHINDIAFFAPPLQGIKDQVYLDGKVKGTVSNLSGTDIKLRLNKSTFLSGDFNVRGLPEVEQTFVHLELEEFQTNAQSLRELPYPPFKEDKHLKLPHYFDSLGTIYFNGSFTGFYNDFVAYGRFGSKLGFIKTDVSLKQNEKQEFAYKGSVKANDFNIGRFFGIKDLSTISLDVDIDGSGFTMATINAKTNGVIQKLNYRNYLYKDIQLNGSFAKETFEGMVVSTDRKLDFVFAGNIDFNRSTPISKFTLDLKNANLGQLNLFNAKDTATQLKFQATFNLEGKHIDDIVGTVNIENLHYRDSQQEHEVNQFNLFAENKLTNRQLKLQSSLLDAKIEGQFKLKHFVEDFKSLVYDFIPTDKEVEVSSSETQDFTYQFDFKDSDPLFKILYSPLAIDSGATLKGYYSNKVKISELEFTGKNIKHNSSYLSEFDLTITSDSSEISLLMEAATLKLAGINSIDTFMLQSYLSQGLNKNKIAWKALNNTPNPAEINISNQLSNIRTMDVHFSDSYITVNDSVWVLSDSSFLKIDSTSIEVSNFNIYNGEQRLSLIGTVSKDSTDILQLNISNIDLAFVSSILPENSIDLQGLAQGEVSLQNVYNNLSLSSDLELNGLVANNVDVGEAQLVSIWNPYIKAFEVKANFGKHEEEKLKLIGKVYPLKKINSLDLQLHFNKFPITLFSPYVTDYITELEGTLNGNIQVRGESQKPMLRGKLELQNSSMLVNYLNTSYTINDYVIVEPDFIGVDLIKIVDEQGNYAIATGTMFHDNYSDFNLDIGLEFEDFLSLNTNSLDNELYYGKAVTSGIANISGFADQLIFEIDLTAEKGTDFKIPLDEGVDVSKSNYLIFTNSPTFDKTDLDVVDLSGIQLNFELEIDQEAKVQIIFDEQIGDIIKAQGEGNLNLEINTLGNFNIYGQYIVDKGDYLFTLKNVVNKRFELVKGSRIYWDGNPYKAQVDMKAIYNLRAPLVDLFPEDSSSGFSRRIPIELELQMQNQLMSPDIGFDIRIPTADENTKRRLESILYVNNNDVNPQEMNRQVFGLLVLNRFMPSTTSEGGSADYGGAPINNGYEFLSNQLSNWFSRLSDDFDVGVNYRPSNEYNSEEVDLSLSTEILNDRLILDGNVGYTGNGPQYNQNQTSNFIGEFTAEYKLSRDGRFRVKGFNRSTNNSLSQVISPYTQGIGLFYREEFDTFGELWRKYFHASE